MTGSTGGDYREFYRDRRVMLTGGLGFIGSTLAHHLVRLGARVLIVDSLIPEYGGNLERMSHYVPAAETPVSL